MLAKIDNISECKNKYVAYSLSSANGESQVIVRDFLRDPQEDRELIEKVLRDGNSLKEVKFCLDERKYLRRN